MRRIKLALMAMAGVVYLSGCHMRAGVGMNMAAAPECPYGYYDAPPYLCAPAGYYGPEWFNGGVFIGAGPWFRGPRRFHGYVDNRFHPDHGFRGAMPARGERPVTANRANSSTFHGNEMRDGRGHVVRR